MGFRNSIWVAETGGYGNTAAGATSTNETQRLLIEYAEENIQQA